jgi:hypothetical protein
VASGPGSRPFFSNCSRSGSSGSLTPSIFNGSRRRDASSLATSTRPSTRGPAISGIGASGDPVAGDSGSDQSLWLVQPPARDNVAARRPEGRYCGRCSMRSTCWPTNPRSWSACGCSRACGAHRAAAPLEGRRRIRPTRPGRGLRSHGQERAEREFPESWIPERPGEQIAGELVRYDRGRTSYGDQIIAVLRLADDLARQAGHLHPEQYTDNPATALPHEPEPVPERYQRELSDEARRKWQVLRAEEIAQKETRSRTNKLKQLETEARCRRRSPRSPPRRRDR